MDDWNFESDLPLNYQAKSIGINDELVELLWRNGQVVLQSQTTRKHVPNRDESSQALLQDQPSSKGSEPDGTLGNSTGFVLDGDDDTVSWIHYPFEDPFEKEFNSNLFSEFASTSPIETDKSVEQYDDKFGAFDSTNVLASSQQNQVTPTAVSKTPANHMPPPKFQYSDLSHKENRICGSEKVTNFSQFSLPLKEGLRSSNAHFGEGASNLVQKDATQYPVMKVGSSHCGSNQMPNDLDLSRASSSGIGPPGCAGKLAKDNAGNMISPSERKGTETLEPTLTSSSGGSGSSSWRASKQSTDVNRHKRKGKNKEESECQSEDGELESAVGDKQTRKSKSARRTRAAEIHNLSERRRRDRINEKMKALQDLIPHCNKTDKASMLDEAIEYLKSLQLHLQVMWMGGGMAPMMFPGVQQYMSQMGMGISPPLLPPNAMHLQRAPLAANPNRVVPCQPPVLNPFDLQNQMQNASFSEQYARYLSFQMQNASQPLNMFKFGPQTLPQGRTMPLPRSSSGAFSGGGTIGSNSLRDKMG